MERSEFIRYSVIKIKKFRLMFSGDLLLKYNAHPPARFLGHGAQPKTHRQPQEFSNVSLIPD